MRLEQGGLLPGQAALAVQQEIAETDIPCFAQLARFTDGRKDTCTSSSADCMPLIQRECKDLFDGIGKASWYTYYRFVRGYKRVTFLTASALRSECLPEPAHVEKV